MLTDYTDQISEAWPTILKTWIEYASLFPIIEYNLEKKTVAALPAKDYIAGLSERTRESTQKKYNEVIAEGGFLLFVCDEKKRVLQSYIYTADDIAI